MDIKHISDNTAELLVDNFDLFDLESLFQLDYNKMQTVKGIGEETARIVMNSIKKDGDKYDTNNRIFHK